MNNIYINKLKKLPFGDYVKCSQCGLFWNSDIINMQIYGHDIVMCRDCFEKFKKKVKRL